MKLINGSYFRSLVPFSIFFKDLSYEYFPLNILLNTSVFKYKGMTQKPTTIYIEVTYEGV